MDFGPKPEHEHSVKPKPKNKKPVSIASLTLLLIVGGILIFSLTNNKNPLPRDIKNQISYKAVYPTAKTGTVKSGYQYQANQKTLSFTVKSPNTKLVFTEQPAPQALGSGNQIYYQALGLHPYAQFQSKLGPVALVKYYQSGNLAPFGQSAVLVAHGTLIFIHSEKNLTNDQWKDLINSLNITK